MYPVVAYQYLGKYEHKYVDTICDLPMYDQEKYPGYTFETDTPSSIFPEWKKPDPVMRVKDCRCVEEKHLDENNVWYWVKVFSCTKHLDRA